MAGASYWLSRKTMLHTAINTALNFLGIAVFETIYRLSRPTLRYFFLSPGTASLKFFVAGAFLGTALYALLRIFIHRRRSGQPLSQNLPAHGLRCALIALSAAFLLELFVFNLRHYEMIAFPRYKPAVLERHNFSPYGFYFNRESQRYTTYQLFSQTYRLELYFEPVAIRNLQLEFKADPPTTRVELRINDEAFEFADHGYELELTPDIPRSLRIPVRTVGKSNRMTILFPDVTGSDDFDFELNRIYLNVQIPLNLSFPRLSILSLFLFAILLFIPGTPAYQQPIHPRSRFQNTVLALTFGLIALYLGWTALSTFSGRVDWNVGAKKILHQLNEIGETAHPTYPIARQLTDALIARQLYLPDRPDNSIQSAERPYDVSYRDHYHVRYQWDRAYYQGRYYAYFGAVPIILTLLPFKLLTGENLPIIFAALMFALAAVAGLFALTHTIVTSFFPEAPFGALILALLGVIAVSSVPWALRRSLIYELSTLSGIAFAIWGVLLTLRTVLTLRNDQAPSHGALIRIATGSLLAGGFSALAVGCRPTMALVFLWAPALIPMIRPQRKAIRAYCVSALSYALPVLIVALLLMRYNQLRFGSIFEFGFSYQLSLPNASLGKITTAPGAVFISALACLFHPFTLSAQFPYISLTPLGTLPYHGYIAHEMSMAGVFAFPFSWGVFALILNRKRASEKKIFPFVSGAFLSAAALLLTVSFVAILFRYTLDFAWIVGLVAVCGWFVWRNGTSVNPDRWFAAAAWVSVLIALALSLNGDQAWFETLNPIQFDRLRYLFSFWL